MPYIQLEVRSHYPTETKKALAKAIGKAYAEIMQADVRRITVVIRELGEGSIWRCSEDEPWPAAIMMCDIPSGRPASMREELSKTLVLLCNTHLELAVNELNIEFTQHSGDEMYHQWLGRLSDDWKPGGN